MICEGAQDLRKSAWPVAEYHPSCSEQTSDSRLQRDTISQLFGTLAGAAHFSQG